MLSLGCRATQSGTNLIELMIGSAIGLIVLSGITAFYSDTARKNAAGLAQVRLNHGIHTALFLMTRDIRRTGYWAASPAGTRWADNPFHDPANALQIAQYSGELPGSCITFSYDLNGDAKVGVGSTQVNGTYYSDINQERFGVRLRNGTIQMRTGGRQSGCNTGSWQSVTEPDITIDKLQFTLLEECRNLLNQDTGCTVDSPFLSLRAVDVQLSGHLAKSPQVAITLAETVHIRNPYLSPAAAGGWQ